MIDSHISLQFFLKDAVNGPKGNVRELSGGGEYISLAMTSLPSPGN